MNYDLIYIFPSRREHCSCVDAKPENNDHNRVDVENDIDKLNLEVTDNQNQMAKYYHLRNP